MSLQIAITPDTVESVALDILTPDPQNLRLHPEAEIAVLMESLRRFGQVKPVVVDAAGVVRAGNGLLEAARRLGWDHLDITRRVDLDGSEATAYAIADNRTAELSTWDTDLLRSALASLEAAGVEVRALGWDDDDRALLLRATAPTTATTTSAEPLPPAWPELRVTLPPLAYERWQEAVRDARGDEVAAFLALLEALT